LISTSEANTFFEAPVPFIILNAVFEWNPLLVHERGSVKRIVQRNFAELKKILNGFEWRIPLMARLSNEFDGLITRDGILPSANSCGELCGRERFFVRAIRA
jgi:hypothetical protein